MRISRVLFAVKACLFIVIGFAMFFNPFDVYALDDSALKQQPQRVLVVYSYHQGYEWNDGLEKGIHDVFNGTGVELKDYFMDTKRNTSIQFKAAAGKEACAIIDSWKPDVVIACDDNAQIFVTQKYIGKKPYFIFCGVNADPADYGFPASNITGILQRTQFNLSLAYLRQILPHVKKIAIISDDDATSIAELQDIQREKSDTVEITDFKSISDFVTWKKRIIEYNQAYKNHEIDALCILNYHTIREDPEISRSMLPKDVMYWTKNNCIVPTMGMRDFAIADGVLCGVVESSEDHGREAAAYAAALLKGVDIKNLPVKISGTGLTMVNLDTAKRLGVSIPESALREAKKVFQARTE